VFVVGPAGRPDHEHREKGKGGRGGLDIRGEELSTMRHYKKGRAGVKLRGWPEIGQDGGVLLAPNVS